MSLPSAQSVVSTLFAAVAARDLSTMLSCYAPDVTIREAASLPYGGCYHGIAGARDHAARFWGTWGRYQPPVDRLDETIYSYDHARVFVQWRHRAHDPRSGARLDDPVTGVYELSHGLVNSSTMFHFDTAAVLAFLRDAQ